MMWLFWIYYFIDVNWLLVRNTMNKGMKTPQTWIQFMTSTWRCVSHEIINMIWLSVSRNWCEYPTWGHSSSIRILSILSRRAGLVWKWFKIINGEWWPSSWLWSDPGWIRQKWIWWRGITPPSACSPSPSANESDTVSDNTKAVTKKLWLSSLAHVKQAALAKVASSSKSSSSSKGLAGFAALIISASLSAAHKETNQGLQSGSWKWSHRPLKAAVGKAV